MLWREKTHFPGNTPTLLLLLLLLLLSLLPALMMLLLQQGQLSFWAQDSTRQQQEASVHRHRHIYLRYHKTLRYRGEKQGHFMHIPTSSTYYKMAYGIVQTKAAIIISGTVLVRRRTTYLLSFKDIIGFELGPRSLDV